MGRICVVAGTRPEIIKMSPVILELIRRNADFFITVPSLTMRQVRIPCQNDKKAGLMQEIKDRASIFGVGTVNRIDGLRMEFDDGWLLVRPSGTEPVVRVIAESVSAFKTQEMVERATGVVQDLIRGIA